MVGDSYLEESLHYLQWGAKFEPSRGCNEFLGYWVYYNDEWLKNSWVVVGLTWPHTLKVLKCANIC